MRKFSKIFAALLVLCLIGGVLAASVTASEGASIVVKGATTKLSDVSQNSIFAYSQQSMDGIKTNGYPSTFASNTQFNGGITKTYPTVNGNTYMRLTYSGVAQSGKPYMDWILGGYFGNNLPAYTDAKGGYHSSTLPAPALSNTDYITLDFDISADAYSILVGYTGGNEDMPVYASVTSLDSAAISKALDAVASDVVAVTPEVAKASAKMAYNDGLYWYICGRYLTYNGTSYAYGYVGMTNDANSRLTTAYLDSDGDGVKDTWYLVAGGAVSANATTTTLPKIELPDSVGSWLHITYVIDVNMQDTGSAYDFSSTVAYMFADGEHFATLTGVLGSASYENITANSGSYTFNTADCITLNSMRFYQPEGVTDNAYSVCLDNFSAHYYGNGTGEYSGELGQYIANNRNALSRVDDDVIPAHIFECSDTVYSVDYPLHSSKYVSADSGMTKTYLSVLVDETLASMKNGATIISTRDIIGFTPPENIDTFTVNLLDGAEFSLSAEADRNYVLQKTGGGYLVRRPNEKEAITLKYLDVNGKVVKEEILKYGVMPNVDSVVLDTVDLQTGDVKAYTNIVWQWDIDGDYYAEIYPAIDRAPEAPRAITLTDIELINQCCDGVLEVKPNVYTETLYTGLKYILTYVDETGVTRPVSSNGTYNRYTNEDALATAVNNAKDGMTLILYTDISTTQTMKISQDNTLCVDLNGKTLTSSANKVFNLCNNSKIFVYSTVGAGSINSDKQSGTVFATVCDGEYFNNCDITVGTSAQNSGNGISVYTNGSNNVSVRTNGGTLLSARTNSTDVNDGKNINVTLDGVLCVGNFEFSAPDIILNVKNGTTLNGNDGDAPLFATSGDGAEATVKVEDSELKSGFIIFNNWSEGCKLHIVSSTVSGYFLCESEEAHGNVVFGRGNEFVGNTNDIRDIDANGLCTLEDGVCYAVKGQDLMTFDPETDNEDGDITSAVWKDANGNVFKKEYYHKDYTVINHPTKADMSDKIKFPIATSLNNGWYSVGYTSWKSATEGTTLDTLQMDKENVFVPVAEGYVTDIDLKANASLKYTDIGLNLYLPIPSEESGVTFNPANNVAVFDSDNNPLTFTIKQDLPGAVGYYAIEIPYALTSFDTYHAVITFTVTKGEETLDLSQEITLDFMTYAETVASVYACGTEESTLIFDLVRYKYEAYKYSTSYELRDAAIAERVDDFFHSHSKKGCACITDLDELKFTAEEKAATLEGNDALDGKILKVGFELKYERPTVYFILASDLDVESLTVTLKGLEHLKGTWDYINYKYTCDMQLVGNVTYDGVTCVKYTYSDLLLCNAAAVLNIKLTVKVPATETEAETVEVLEGKFSLATYCEELVSENSDAATLAKAFYAASKSALEYRYIREGE